MADASSGRSSQVTFGCSRVRGCSAPSDRPPQSTPWTKFKADKAGVGVEMLMTGEDAGHEVSFASTHGASPKYSPKPRADWSTPAAHEDNFLNPPHS